MALCLRYLVLVMEYCYIQLVYVLVVENFFIMSKLKISYYPFKIF
nr:MAG TPA: hypothetical protein [Caudoviricetes sp.]DAS55851.1 MAG TPA: hypothetical protein [Caudoviricetes sp.]